MAYFAELDENDVVMRVLVVPDEQTQRGEAYLRDDLGLGGRWTPTSYTKRHRGRFAGPGMRWNEELGAFLLPQPFTSWSLDAAGDLHPPVPRPDGENWHWDEANLAWVEETL